MLAIVQAIGMTLGMFRKALVSKDTFSVTVIVITLAAGTAFLMWLGEQINERGIGNGISLLIFGGIIARLPAAIHATWTKYGNGEVSLMTIILFVVFS